MIKRVSLVITVAVALMAVSCSSSSDVDFPQGLERVDIELTAIEQNIAENQYDFPVNLLSSAYETEEKGNIMVSPLSASMVMGMVANAIDAEDRTEILKTLNINEAELESYNAYMHKLLETLPTIDPKSTFSINNAFWLTNQANMSAGYNQVLNDSYASEIGRFDEFNTTVINEINNWINQKTSGGIRKLLEEEDADSSLQTAWVNALYFKGNWYQKFDKTKTEISHFYHNYPNKSTYTNVEMMYGNKFRYCHYLLPKGGVDYDDVITSVMLPYGNETFIFTAILPSVNNPDIAATLKELTTEYWQKIDEICAKESKSGNIAVCMPKITLEKTTDMIPILKSMGLNNTLDKYNGVSMSANLGLYNQYISLFRQSAVLDVDEEGSEIKVATVATGGYAAAPGPPELIEFNRPFIYFVRERSTGAVILAGVFSQP